jgi:hypothetical protein
MPNASREKNEKRLGSTDIERQIVKPEAPNEGITRCAFVDELANLRMIPNLIFCYRERFDPARLRKSLAQVLNDFSVYAGRLYRSDGVWAIERGKLGVAFEVAKSAVTCVELCEIEKTERKVDSSLFCPRISVRNAMRGKEALVAARITETQDGSVLGMTFHHMAGDPVSMMALMRAWAQAYNNKPYIIPLEVDDRDEYISEHIPRQSGDVEPLSLSSWGNYLSLCQHVLTHPARRVIFEYTWSDVSSIRAAAERERPVTDIDALAAHVFLTIRRLHDQNADATLGLSVNTRKRIGLPMNMLGNPIDIVRVKTSPSDGIANVASGLRTRIESFTSKEFRHQAVMAFKAGAPSAGQRLRFGPAFFHLDPYKGNLLVASLIKMGFYELVFEKNAPVLIKGNPFGSERAFGWYANLVESPENAGITVEVWLPSKLARRLEQEMKRPATDVLRDNEAQLSARTTSA